MIKQKLKQYLDELVIKYETPDFIKSDPIQFPHRYKNQVDIEVSALLSSSLAYGKRELFIKKLEYLHSEILGESPEKYCLNFQIESELKKLETFSYRYTSGIDIVMLLNSISLALKEFSSLENLFMKSYNRSDKNVKNSLDNFTLKLIDYNKDFACSKGFCYLLPRSSQGSACKRLNLFLKWMVRKGPVDLNLWKKISTSQLIIPLDVHVANTSRKLELTSRRSNDWKTAEEITDKLIQLDPNDPTKYDFALFDIGIDKLL